jgi:acetyltransferase-like isoleucine patch superfamily enzyme
MHFRSKNVLVRNGKYLTIGKNVAFGEGVRIDAFGQEGISLADRVTVGEGALLSVSGVVAEPGEFIRVGRHSAVGRNNIVWGQGGVQIGENCLLGPNCVLVSENHRFSDLAELIREQGHVRAPILIGDNCWLGANVVVGPGVMIGEGAVIGAGAVVVSDIPPFQTAVGIPARVVDSRRDNR